MIAHEIQPVHDSGERIQPKAGARGEILDDCCGLRAAAGFDEQVVCGRVGGECLERGAEFFPQRAAERTAVEVHELVTAAFARGADEFRIHGEFAQVIHEHGKTPRRTIAQQPLEQRRFPRAEKAAQHGDG